MCNNEKVYKSEEVNAMVLGMGKGRKGEARIGEGGKEERLSCFRRRYPQPAINTNLRGEGASLCVLAGIQNSPLP